MFFSTLCPTAFVTPDEPAKQARSGVSRMPQNLRRPRPASLFFVTPDERSEIRGLVAAAACEAPKLPNFARRGSGPVPDLIRDPAGTVLLRYDYFNSRRGVPDRAGLRPACPERRSFLMPLRPLRHPGRACEAGEIRGLAYAAKSPSPRASAARRAGLRPACPERRGIFFSTPCPTAFVTPDEPAKQARSGVSRMPQNPRHPGQAPPGARPGVCPELDSGPVLNLIQGPARTETEPFSFKTSRDPQPAPKAIPGLARSVDPKNAATKTTRRHPEPSTPSS